MPPRRRCGHCRASQKKCDGQRPACSRCSNRRLECSYEPADGWSFVDQNAFSADLSRRSARRNRNRTANDIAVFDIPPAPIWDLNHRVLDRFMSRWTAGLTCLAGQNSLRTVYQQDPETSAMSAAILALSYADLTVFERQGDRASQSFLAYDKAICRIQSQLDLSKCDALTSEGALAAILVIDAYEILYLRRVAPLGVHTIAIANLLNTQYGLRQLHEPPSPLGQVAGPRILGRQLLCKLPPLCEHIPAYEILGPRALDQHTMNFVNRACGLLYLANNKEMKAKEPETPVQRPSNMAYALGKLLEDAQSWFDDNPAITVPHEVNIVSTQPQMKQAMPNLPTVLVSPQKWIIRNWILYHMGRIRILDELIDNWSHIAACSQFGKRSTLSWVHDVNTSAAFLLKCIPFLMGLVDINGVLSSSPLNDTGLLIAQYPLWMVLDCGNTYSDLKYTATQSLEYIDQRRNITVTL